MNTEKKKLRSTKRSSLNEMYRYYAGFSEEFITDLFCILKINKKHIVLDPWNGSGTTTFISSVLGVNSIGIDLNPMMGIIAKAKLHRKEISLEEFSGLVKKSRRYRKMPRESDSLCKWFEISSVKTIRNFEREILNGKTIKSIQSDIDNVSVKECFLVLILINTVKTFSSKISTSNPSWIKQSEEEKKLEISKEEFENKLFDEYYKLTNLIQNNKFEIGTFPYLLNGNSENLPLLDSSVDYIITSPPYCTRIDYAVMTNVELALLNISSDDFHKLRHSLTGGPVIHKNQPNTSQLWGQLCETTLSRIKSHHSYASESYYYKTYLQYFDSMFKSFKELNRVLKPDGYCVIVVQDSFYKDIFIDLKNIFCEFSSMFGWKVMDIYDFEVKNNISKSNNRAKKYNKNYEVREHVLVFKKGENFSGA